MPFPEYNMYICTYIYECLFLMLHLEFNSVCVCESCQDVEKFVSSCRKCRNHVCVLLSLLLLMLKVGPKCLDDPCFLGLGKQI